MIKKIQNKAASLLSSLDIHTQEVLRKTSATTLVRAAGMVFGILTSIILGRLLGAKGLGIINLTNQIISILLMVTMLGFPTVILKEVSIAYSRKDSHHINSVITTSFKINGIIGITVIVTVLFLTNFISNRIFNEPDLRSPLTIAVVAMLFQVYSRIIAAGVNGYRKIWQSSLVDNTLSLFIVFVGILILYVTKYPINVISVAWCFAISRVAVSISIGTYWYKIHSPIPNADFIPKQLFKVALPLLFVQATNTISSSIDTILIGTFLDTKAIGIYSIALRIAFASSFFLLVTNSSLGPKVAELFANQQLDKLQTTIQNITKVLSIISIIIFLLIILLGKIILGIWGDEFKNAYWPLVILSTGQVINISTGCVGLTLTLCNQEKIWGYVKLFSAILNILLNILLIRWWGINGAALSTALNMIIINIIALILVKRRIKINPIPYKLFS